MTTRRFSRTQILLRSLLAVFVIATSVLFISLPAHADPDDANPDASSSGCGSAHNTDDNADDDKHSGADPPQSDDGANDSQANSSLDGMASLFSQASCSALSAALNRLGLWTTPCLEQKAGACGQQGADKPNWFITHYRMMRVMGLYILMPMVLIAIIHAVMKASLPALLKSVFLYLPIAIIGTTVAVDLVQLLLDVTDDFSAVFINAIITDSNSYWESVAAGVGDDSIPFILDIFLALALALICVFVYVIMVVRESSVYIATSFLPIGFALMVWPSTAKWFKRMIEFLVGVVLSKLVMVAAISLAIACLSAANNHGKTDAGSTLAANGGNVGTVGIVSDKGGFMYQVSDIVSALALLLIVCYAPSMTISLVGKLGLNEVASHVGGALNRPNGIQQVLFYDRLMATAGNARALYTAAGNRADTIATMRNTSLVEQRLNSAGIYRNAAGNFAIDDAMLDAAGITNATHRDELKRWTDPARNRDNNNANDILRAYVALGMGENYEGYLGDAAHPVDRVRNPNYFLEDSVGAVLIGKDGSRQIVINAADRNGRSLKHVPGAMLERVVEAVADERIAHTGGVAKINVILPVRSRMDGDPANQGARPVAHSTIEEHLESTVYNAVNNVRRRYERTDPTDTRRVDITASFRQPASMWSRINRELDPDAAVDAQGRF